MSGRLGYVYFLQPKWDPDGPVKIGFSNNPWQRCIALNRNSERAHLTIIGVFPGTLAEERQLHKRWAEHRVLGEWFRPAPEILEAARLCAALHLDPEARVYHDEAKGWTGGLVPGGRASYRGVPS